MEVREKRTGNDVRVAERTLHLPVTGTFLTWICAVALQSYGVTEQQSYRVDRLMFKRKEADQKVQIQVYIDIF